jgi:hypothetical protein
VTVLPRDIRCRVQERRGEAEEGNISYVMHGKLLSAPNHTDFAHGLLIVPPS